MNREAVALGTPVYSTFEGRLGAVDELLIARPVACAGSSDAAELELRQARPRGAADHAPARTPGPPPAASSCCSRRSRRRSRPTRSPGSYNPRNAPTDPRGRPSRCIATRSPARRRRGCWSRSPTTSRSSCASTTARTATTRSCATARSGGCSIGCLPVLVLARVYQRRWRYASQRDYEAVARAIVAIVLLTAVAIEVVRPVQRYYVHGDAPHAHRDASACPTA